ncbi:MAG: glycosyltransferase [Minisyncoccota bacterium]
MKFSIVTPVHNGERYITETIESVLSQEGDFEIEYIIQDGSSTDRTIAIVRTFEAKLRSGSYPVKCQNIVFRCFSEKDGGMYDAVEKGFAKMTGDVMAYVNADDRYLPGAFATVSNIFKTYPEIAWLKGINTTCDEAGTPMADGSCFLYRQGWLRKGIYGRSAYFVQQDSVFWRRSLWNVARPHISAYRLAGDYALWVAFATHVPLWSFNKRVSTFRRRVGQLSSVMEPYRQEQEAIAPHDPFLEKRVLLFFSLTRLFGLNPKHAVTRFLFFMLFPLHGQEWYIDFDMQGKPVKRLSPTYIA